MTFRVGKAYDLVLYGWAVARTARGDCTAVHRRLSDVRRDDFLRGRIDLGNPAGKLSRMPDTVCIRARCSPEVRPRVVELIDLAVLSRHLRIIDGTAVDPRRGSGLEALDC